MLPYGIVFTENMFSFSESVKVYQKGYGILRPVSLVKIFSVLWIVMAAVGTAIYFYEKDIAYLIYFLVLTVIVNIVMYFNTKKFFIKRICSANFSPSEKQIVLYDEYFEITTGYSKSVYYYDEIYEINISDSLITIILDPVILPLSISSSEIKKGEYSVFLNFLKEKAAKKIKNGGGRSI